MAESTAIIGWKSTLEFSSDGGTTYSTIYGTQSHNRKKSTNAVDVTSKDDAGVKRVKAGMKSADFSFDGFTLLADNAQVALRAAEVANTMLKWRYRENGSGSGFPQEVFDGFVASLDEKSPVDGVISLSMSVAVDGAIVRSNQ